MSLKIRIILITVVILAVLVILSFIFTKPPKNKSPMPLPVQQSQTTPSTTTENSTDFSFNKEKRDLLIEKIDHKPGLSSSDQAAKEKLLAVNNNQPDLVFQTKQFRVDYIQSGDFYQVEILDSNYLDAKKAALEWFRSFGFSQTGICNLPIMFTLSGEVKQSLIDKDINFNYLPEGC